LNKKVIIDWIDLDDYGFDSNIPDGTIITIEPIRVKTPNGVVRVIRFRNDLDDIIINNKFGDI
jgi:hypothetical protein